MVKYIKKKKGQNSEINLIILSIFRTQFVFVFVFLTGQE